MTKATEIILSLYDKNYKNGERANALSQGLTSELLRKELKTYKASYTFSLSHGDLVNLLVAHVEKDSKTIDALKKVGHDNYFKYVKYVPKKKTAKKVVAKKEPKKAKAEVKTEAVA